MEKTTIIKAGALIDGVSEGPRTDCSIVIKGDRIFDVTNSLESNNEAEFLDLSEYTVLPGLIDCHTHLTFEIGKGQTTKDFYFKTDADHAIKATTYAQRTLMAGFTTVRDVGSVNFIDVSLRNAINSGIIPGPRMFVATHIISITGGHGDFCSGFPPGLLPESTYQNGIINSPQEGVHAVRYAIKHGANHIKIAATGGVISEEEFASDQQLLNSEIKAIVETAHLLGRKVLAHAHGNKGIKAALSAGVDSIEHGSYLDQECIDLMNENGVYLVPTLSAGELLIKAADTPGYFPPVIAEKAREVGPKVKESLMRAYRNNLKIAFGTDAGVYPHGDNGKEFQYLVDAGVSPLDSIFMATRNAANLLGKSNELGSVQTGRFADLVAVKGDPLEDITLLQNIAFVMKSGVVYKWL